MNIKEAKEQIMKTVKIYLQKDEYGDYAIPYVRQRPIFMVGAPGIGKTAIMEQIAQELDIGIISYSMSHHTRQSALGLPFITHKEYDGKTFDISEYTMSEIIATIYKTMNLSGMREGILFLDEINCVSETLAPTMLQFLQMKKFGTHAMPPGWIIVTAGNPPQYNRSVREFDIATMDRLKIIDVEPDYKVWREYATTRGIHGAVLSYLDIRKHDFYTIETSAKGKNYVTARGWEDLSAMLYMYEQNDYIVNQTFVIQYLKHEEIATDFAVYYELYNKYKSDYEVETILAGQASEEVNKRAVMANFDERLSLLGILLNVLHAKIRMFLEREQMIIKLRQIMLVVKEERIGHRLDNLLREKTSLINKELKRRQLANSISDEQRMTDKILMRTLNDMLRLAVLHSDDQEAAFHQTRDAFNEAVHSLEDEREEIRVMMDNIFRFVEDNWGISKEMVIVVNDLTMNASTAQFIAENGCDKYYTYNKELLFTDKKQALLHEIRDAEYFIPVSS
ncbi:MAG: AAA family ATPase [Eubacteriales bacterium]|nr:AAA family ATPase [Eubacteriales bacterium]